MLAETLPTKSWCVLGNIILQLKQPSGFRTHNTGFRVVRGVLWKSRRVRARMQGCVFGIIQIPGVCVWNNTISWGVCLNSSWPHISPHTIGE